MNVAGIEYQPFFEVCKMGRQHTTDEIAGYRRRTREVLAGGLRDHSSRPGRDWLGNRWVTGASKINVMLLKGATIERMETARHAVKEHLYDLTVNKGVPVKCVAGVYSFDESALSDVKQF